MGQIFYENSNLEMQFLCTSHKSFRNVEIILFSVHYKTSDLSKFINMKLLYIKLGIERQSAYFIDYKAMSKKCRYKLPIYGYLPLEVTD